MINKKHFEEAMQRSHAKKIDIDAQNHIKPKVEDASNDPSQTEHAYQLFIEPRVPTLGLCFVSSKQTLC